MGSNQQKYDAEFREGAARIVIETGKPIPGVAEDLGVHPGTLHSGLLWEAEHAELERLRREMSEKNKRTQA
jgi:transposase